MMKIVILGAPGAGKGTIAKMANEQLGVPHISTGDLFRNEISNATELGMKVKKIMAEGQLVPDEVTIEILKKRIQKDDAKNGFILDGFPRTLPQADALAGLQEMDVVVNVKVPDEHIIKRLSGRRMCSKCGKNYHILYMPPKKENVCDVCGSELLQRDDDKPASIKKRLEVYRSQTEPLIDYYDKKGKLTEINGVGTPKEVLLRFLDVVKQNQ